MAAAGARALKPGTWRRGKGGRTANGFAVPMPAWNRQAEIPLKKSAESGKFLRINGEASPFRVDAGLLYTFPAGASAKPLPEETPVAETPALRPGDGSDLSVSSPVASLFAASRSGHKTPAGRLRALSFRLGRRDSPLAAGIVFPSGHGGAEENGNTTPARVTIPLPSCGPEPGFTDRIRAGSRGKREKKSIPAESRAFFMKRLPEDQGS